MSRAINIEALIAAVNNLADEAKDLLTVRLEDAEAEDARRVWQLGSEIEAIAVELAFAASAQVIVEAILDHLYNRAAEYANLLGTRMPDAQEYGDFYYLPVRPPHAFGERFGGPGYDFYCDDIRKVYHRAVRDALGKEWQPRETAGEDLEAWARGLGL